MRKYKLKFLLSLAVLAGGLFFLPSIDAAHANTATDGVVSVYTKPLTNLAKLGGTTNWAVSLPTGYSYTAFNVQIATDPTEAADGSGFLSQNLVPTSIPGGIGTYINNGNHASTSIKAANFQNLTYGTYYYQINAQYKAPDTTLHWIGWALGDDTINITCAGNSTQTIVCPTDPPTISGLNVTLAWTDTGAFAQTAYQVQISTDDSFVDSTQTVYDSGAVISTANKITVPLPSGDYYWRVQLWNKNATTSPNSPTDQNSTGWAEPYTQFDMSCSGDANQIVVCTGKVTVSGTDVTLNWSTTGKVNTETAFQIQVDDNSDFSSPTLDSGKVSGSVKQATVNSQEPNGIYTYYVGFTAYKAYNFSNQLPSGQYYWRIQVWNANGSTGWKIANSPFFMGCSGDPSKIEACAQTATVDGLSATLKWIMSGPNRSVCLKYFPYTCFTYWNFKQSNIQVQLSTTGSTPNDFLSPYRDTGVISQPVDFTSTPTSTVPSDTYTFSNLDQGTYYWRINVQDANGNWTGWAYVANPFSISRCSGDPNQIVVCATSMQSPIWGSDGYLKWTLGGSYKTQKYYEVQISTDHNFSGTASSDISKLGEGVYFDTGQVLSSATSFNYTNLSAYWNAPLGGSPQENDLGGDYYWRVKVWNNQLINGSYYSTDWAIPNLYTDSTTGQSYNLNIKNAVNANITLDANSADPATEIFNWQGTFGNVWSAVQVQVAPSGDNFNNIKCDSGWQAVASSTTSLTLSSCSFALGDQWRVRLKAKAPYAYYVSKWSNTTVGAMQCNGNINNATKCLNLGDTQDESGLTKNLPYTAVNSCTSAKCEMQCNANYQVGTGAYAGQCNFCLVPQPTACDCTGQQTINWVLNTNTTQCPLGASNVTPYSITATCTPPSNCPLPKNWREVSPN